MTPQAPVDTPSRTPQDTPRQRAEADIAAALDQIQVAYWTVVHAEGRAIDPRDLGLDGAAADLLAEAYDIALRIEARAAADGEGWAEARQFFL